MTTTPMIANLIREFLKAKKISSASDMVAAYGTYKAERDGNGYKFRLKTGKDDPYGFEIEINYVVSEDNGRYELLIYRESGHELFRLVFQNDYGNVEMHLIKEFALDFDVLDKELEKLSRE